MNHGMVASEFQKNLSKESNWMGYERSSDDAGFV